MCGDGFGRLRSLQSKMTEFYAKNRYSARRCLEHESFYIFRNNIDESLEKIGIVDFPKCEKKSKGNMERKTFTTRDLFEKALSVVSSCEVEKQKKWNLLHNHDMNLLFEEALLFGDNQLLNEEIRIEVEKCPTYYILLASLNIKKICELRASDKNNSKKYSCRISRILTLILRIFIDFKARCSDNRLLKYLLRYFRLFEIELREKLHIIIRHLLNEPYSISDEGIDAELHRKYFRICEEEFREIIVNTQATNSKLFQIELVISLSFFFGNYQHNDSIDIDDETANSILHKLLSLSRTTKNLVTYEEFATLLTNIIGFSTRNRFENTVNYAISSIIESHEKEGSITRPDCFWSIDYESRVTDLGVIASKLVMLADLVKFSKGIAPTIISIIELRKNHQQIFDLEFLPQISLQDDRPRSKQIDYAFECCLKFVFEVLRSNTVMPMNLNPNKRIPIFIEKFQKSLERRFFEIFCYSRLPRAIRVQTLNLVLLLNTTDRIIAELSKSPGMIALLLDDVGSLCGKESGSQRIVLSFVCHVINYITAHHKDLLQTLASKLLKNLLLVASENQKEIARIKWPSLFYHFKDRILRSLNLVLINDADLLQTIDHQANLSDLCDIRDNLDISTMILELCEQNNQRILEGELDISRGIEKSRSLVKSMYLSINFALKFLIKI
ncbi:MAG: hypothetical protein MHMPM18_000254 [Marteilia pararefringens]